MRMVENKYISLAIIQLVIGTFLSGEGLLFMVTLSNSEEVNWTNIAFVFLVSGIVHIISGVITLTRKMIV